MPVPSQRWASIPSAVILQSVGGLGGKGAGGAFSPAAGGAAGGNGGTVTGRNDGTINDPRRL